MSNGLKDINKRIGDRSECFYWQTDRKISAEEASLIWKDRHSAISNEELLGKINSVLKEDKLAYIKPFDKNAQTSSGYVNSIRVGILESGKKVIIRCHPKGVKNGYFYSESLASNIALKNNIPAYNTYLIHELENENDISYQVIEKLDGDTVQFYLKEHPEKEEKIVYEIGKAMAKLHKVKVNGFGPFNNDDTITGVIDWDECVGGHPIQEIACWSTFFNLERIPLFLKGYFSENSKYDNFDEMFQLFRLRYTISKMALRITRYTYLQTPALKSKIESGKKQLEELSEIFSLNGKNEKEVER